MARLTREALTEDTLCNWRGSVEAGTPAHPHVVTLLIDEVLALRAELASVRDYYERGAPNSTPPGGWWG